MKFYQMAKEASTLIYDNKSSKGTNLRELTSINVDGSVPWVATGGEDQKLVIWDLQHSASRGICNHEVVLVS